VVGGKLLLRRAWALGAPFGVNPFALDIAKDFVTALAPTPDQAAFEQVSAALWELIDLKAMRARLGDKEYASSLAGQAIVAYLDEDSPLDALSEMAWLVIRHEVHDGEPWICLELLVWH
jgi:hypothetical protein